MILFPHAGKGLSDGAAGHWARLLESSEPEQTGPWEVQGVAVEETRGEDLPDLECSRNVDHSMASPE